jgi:hypothetical protein
MTKITVVGNELHTWICRIDHSTYFMSVSTAVSRYLQFRVCSYGKKARTAAPRYLVIRYLGSLSISYGFAGQVLPFSTKNYLLSRIFAIS